MNWLYGVAGALAFAAWLLPYLDARRIGWNPVRLDREPADGPESLPHLSVIVPALNEEETIEKAMRTLLTLDYPELEIIAVDDRSTDRTGTILDRLACEDSRLRVVHVQTLPPGWLGKNHALHKGSQQATGDFMLFTDADCHFDPTALRRTVRYALRRNLDHLVLFPEILLYGFWETLAVWFFGVVFTMKFRPWRVADPKSKAFMGIGAFNLVRTQTYRKSGGHASMPMDIADDMKLGKRMKESGGRAECGLSGGLVKVRWVSGVRGIVLGLTKNAFAGLNYNPFMALVSSIGLFVIGVWPILGLGVGPWGARLLCASTLALMVWTAAKAPPRERMSPLYGLGFPLAALIVLYIIWRSMIYTYRQGGVVWRGTLYPLAELRKGLV